MELTQALAVLDDASEALDQTVSALPPRRWSRPTPARGWNIATQIGHLVWSDEVSLRALRRDPELEQFLARVAGSAVSGFVDRGARERAALPVLHLLHEWRAGRRALARAVLEADPGGRVNLLGQQVLPRTLVAARIVETWAHALDVYDALAMQAPSTAGVNVVARMGMRTREASFRARDIELPVAAVRVDLAAAHGERLEFGPADAPESVAGDAWSFAAVVTQRRNVADVKLDVAGDGAARWMRIAQAFGGVPTNGPAPGARLEWHR
ncbi:maleylpyruvate isomerase family mycothiol-dependent enzyme [Leucobacter albus]|uniref:Maleylpyruvate isomerase family mycothiol-dependent enzyme n=1 Tax=Leucobacter albus TaxID=272210 RepID=A0ABW3TLR4_9MICO